ncbi:hypothetical protein, partial [Paraburkholderia sediminicola]|uniref:hypothetical protein n=1 Tax=Paraburkholderia sediminicola TaxID=458836 RepID=UPI0038B9CEA7
GMQRKVGAAPHRGNTNRPLTKQGKANAPRTLTNKRRAGKPPHLVQKNSLHIPCQNKNQKLPCDKFV